MNIMFVMGLDGSQLNSKCRLDKLDGLYGLLLEYWGGEMNPQYNEALKTIIHRLQEKGIEKIDAFIASKPVIENIPDKNKRRLSNSDDGCFYITQKNAETLRLELCKQQKFFSATSKKEKPTGNGTKTIFLHVSEIKTEKEWKEIILDGYSCDFDHTDNSELLDIRVSRIFKKTLFKPLGSITPKKSINKVEVYARCPDVIAFTLKESNGFCEYCSKPAPFLKNLGLPYLEVHHVIPLSKGGPDTPENCVALCPNCHKALHFAENQKERTDALYEKHPRLKK